MLVLDKVTHLVGWGIVIIYETNGEAKHQHQLAILNTRIAGLNKQYLAGRQVLSISKELFEAEGKSINQDQLRFDSPGIAGPGKNFGWRQVFSISKELFRKKRRQKA